MYHRSMLMIIPVFRSGSKGEKQKWTKKAAFLAALSFFCLFYKFSAMSPSLTQPNRRNNRSNNRDNSAGKIKQMSTRPTQSIAVMAARVPLAISCIQPV